MEIKIGRKDLVWSYMGYFLQICSNVLLLPIILNKISSIELGLWYTFASVGNLVNLLDMGFSPTLARNITYAWSGAADIKKEGAVLSASKSEPNYHLFVSVFMACKRINLIISLIAIAVLIFAGTPYILYVIKKDFSLRYIIAWMIYCGAIFVNLYFNYWSTALRGIGAIMQSQKAVVVSYLFYLILCGVGVFFGYGLIAMSIGFFAKGFVLRIVSKKYLVNNEKLDAKINDGKFSYDKEEIREIIRKVWYNAKKTGTVSLCAFVITQSNTMICSAFIGLEATASYGLCLQIVNLIKDVSRIYYSANEPRIASCRITNDKKKLTELYSTSVAVYWSTFVICIIAVIFVGLPILSIIKSDTVLPLFMVIFMGAYLALEGNHSIAANYIATGNNVPYLIPSIVAAVAIAIGSLTGAMITHNIYCLMAVQCIVQLCYANWKWPYVVMKELRLNIISIIKIGYRCLVKTLVSGS